MPRWNSCNILHIAPDAKRLWQFDAKGKGYALSKEQRVAHADRLPGKWVAKSWGALLQPKLNIAWLPVESVFLRVVELPAANAEDTHSMVELQLEKLSPIPVTQLVWTMHFLGTHQGAVKADGTAESLQTVIVVIAARTTVEEFLGRLERDGFLSDRLETPMLDQLEAIGAKDDGVWLFPMTLASQNAALVAWHFGGAWRNLSFVALPPAGDRAAELKHQLSLLSMAGEVEGWLNTQPRWHLVADPVNAAEWEQLLRTALNEPVLVTAPPSPADLAGRSALRATAAGSKAQLQPPEYAERYRQQNFDRLWLHGLAFAGILYAVWLAVYFGVILPVASYQTRGVESQVAAISGSYTNAIELRERLDVLQKRAELKYAALDSWRLLAEKLPASIALKRIGFAGGNKLILNGTTDSTGIQTLNDFYEALRKARLNEKDPNSPTFFDPEPPSNEALNYHMTGDQVYWSFTLTLAHVDEEVVAR